MINRLRVVAGSLSIALTNEQQLLTAVVGHATFAQHPLLQDPEAFQAAHPALVYNLHQLGVINHYTHNQEAAPPSPGSPDSNITEAYSNPPSQNVTPVAAPVHAAASPAVTRSTARQQANIFALQWPDTPIPAAAPAAPPRIQRQLPMSPNVASPDEPGTL